MTDEVLVMLLEQGLSVRKLSDDLLVRSEANGHWNTCGVVWTFRPTGGGHAEGKILLHDRVELARLLDEVAAVRLEGLETGVSRCEIHVRSDSEVGATCGGRKGSVGGAVDGDPDARGRITHGAAPIERRRRARRVAAAAELVDLGLNARRRDSEVGVTAHLLRRLRAADDLDQRGGCLDGARRWQLRGQPPGGNDALEGIDRCDVVAARRVCRSAWDYVEAV